MSQILMPTEPGDPNAAPAADPGTAAAGPMLCVSIHDVAPATWSDCLRLVQAVRAVADIPLTWLVVPHYHFRPEQSPGMEACLNVALERGDELALHGYSHLDTEAGGGGLSARFLRNVYTRREGEFAALTEAEARRRLELGLEWFAARGWTPSGFVPPAWLLGEGAWRALRDAPFAYTTTFSHFHCLPGGQERAAAAGAERGSMPSTQARGNGAASTARPHPATVPADRARMRAASRDARTYQAEAGASIQSGNGGYGGGNAGNGGAHGAGMGSVQNGQGNQSGQGSLNRQFDASGWRDAAGSGTGGGSDAGPGARTGSGYDAGDGPRQLRDQPPSPTPNQNPNANERHAQHVWHAEQHLLAQNNRRGTHAILSPSLVYAARNRSGRILSRHVADATAAMLARSPLVRFSLHPPDARYPELVRHIQHVLERLLEQREAVTKAEFARRVAAGLTSTGRASPANSPDPSRNSPAHSAADRTSYSD